MLGIDPGSQLTGYGVVGIESQRLSHIESGVVNVGKYDMSLRLRLIYEKITSLISTHAVSRFAIETAFMSVNPQSALKLGQARGAAITAAAMCDLKVSEYSPRTIKSAVAGTGRASKEQVQFMTKTLLQLPEIPQSDAADALAVAICDAQSSSFQHVLRTQFVN